MYLWSNKLNYCVRIYFSYKKLELAPRTIIFFVRDSIFFILHISLSNKSQHEHIIN